MPKKKKQAARELHLKPVHYFWLFLFVHLAGWTIIVTLVSPNAPLDVIEGLVWGREWLFGTHKHPPMQAWWLETLTYLTGRASWTPFLASQLAVAIAFWAVWQTGRRLTNDKTALVGVLLLEGVAYYTFTTPEFNPNVLQLPFWALACWSFHRAVKENRWYDWVLLGLWSAGGLYSKYSTVLLLQVFVLVLVFQPEARKRLTNFGPYLALAVLLFLMTPHIQWLLANDFLPFAYAGDRAKPATHLYQHLTHPLAFLGAQGLSLLAAGLLFLVLTKGRVVWNRDGRGSARALSPFDRVFLNATALGPIVLLVLLSVITGLRPRDMWGSCFWNFIGLWFVLHLGPSLTRPCLRRFAIGLCVLFTVSLSVYYVGLKYLIPAHTPKPLRVYYPGRELARQIAEAWDARMHKPLTYIVGDTWVAGNIAYYNPQTPVAERAHVLIAGDRRLSGWIDPEKMAKEGGVLVWCNASNRCNDPREAESIPESLRNKFPTAELQKPVTASLQTTGEYSPA
ncbi:MAG: glycosyltransferase family 39 protein, partial [Alphaproteobacteria bacterium]|nr:glycosyltransferase family 39 protein [Alphaproteobacteria bacterium]